MRIFRNCEEYIREMDRELFQSGIKVAVNHYQNKKQKYNNNFGADLPECRSKGQTNKPAEETGTFPHNSIAVKFSKGLPKIHTGNRFTEQIYRSAEKQYNPNNKRDFPCHSAAGSFKRRNNGNIQKQNWPHDGTGPKQPHNLAMQPIPYMLTGN